MKFRFDSWYYHRKWMEFEYSYAYVKVGHFFQNASLEVHYVTWEWYSDLVHEIPVSLVVLSSKMDGI